MAIGALDEKERDNVCPRCDRELYVFRTAAGQILRCRGWDLTGTPCTLIKACPDEAVNFKDKHHDAFSVPTKTRFCTQISYSYKSY